MIHDVYHKILRSNLIRTLLEQTMSSTESDLDLLVIGAGPVGLTAALEASRLGLSVRIVERKEKRSSHDSRAVVVHPRVMELLEPINNGGVIEEIQKTAFHLQGVFFYMKRWFGKGAKGDCHDHMLLNLNNVEWGDTEHPNLFFLPQYETERIMEEALNAFDVSVEYGVSLENLTQTGNSVESTLTKDDTSETVSSKWVLGADGGRSKTRELIEVGMTRHRSDLYFIIADLVFKGNPPIDTHSSGKCGHIFPTHDGVIAMFPLPGDNHYRILGQAPDGIKSKDEANLDASFFEKFFYDRTGKKFEVELGLWQTIFEITHGTSHSYRKGNVILAGDASHVHSPVGGQGMNLGIQDANNISWKLAWVKRILDNASNDEEKTAAAASADIIIGSYDTERRALGQSIVGSIKKATTVLATKNPFVRFVRNMILRVAVPRNGTQNNFRKAGQLELSYPPKSSSIIVDISKLPKNAYICSPGNRLPNIRLKDGSHLHDHIDRVYHTWVFLNHIPESSRSKEQVSYQKVVHVSASEYNHQVSIPLISKQAYAAEQVLLVRPDQFVAGVGNSMQALIEDLKLAGLDDNALAVM